MALLHASSSSSVSPAKDYENAIKFYSQAIELNPSNAIYYGNRSLAYLRTECYGYALADATRAIEMDKKYIKGYYRRAASNMALGKFRAALRDYETVSRASGSRPAPEPGGCRGPAGGRAGGGVRCVCPEGRERAVHQLLSTYSSTNAEALVPEPLPWSYPGSAVTGLPGPAARPLGRLLHVCHMGAQQPYLGGLPWRVNELLLPECFEHGQCSGTGAVVVIVLSAE